MIEFAIAALCLVSVLVSVSTVLVVSVVVRAHEKIAARAAQAAEASLAATLKHLESTQVIGGTPTGLARTQADFQMEMQKQELETAREMAKRRFADEREVLE